jgi:hypothetical protein
MRILAFGTLLVMLGQPTERLLDLTRNVHEQTLRGDRIFTNTDDAPCPDRSNGRLERAPSVAVAIERLDSSEYSMGGQIVADLRVTNTGVRTVWFPWILRNEFGQRAIFEGANAVEVGLGISAVDARGRAHDLTGSVLRGSRDLPGTLQPIASGESVRIRFPAWILIVDGPSAPIPGDAQLFVTLRFRDGACRAWEPVRSHAVKISLR